MRNFIFFFVTSFITFRSCRHLDRKHTVFGKIVGGLESLNAIEKIEVDNKDRPIEDIILQRARVFVDPYQEADDQLATERTAELERAAQEAKRERTKNKSSSAGSTPNVYRSGAGKYIKIGGGSSETPPLTYPRAENETSLGKTNKRKRMHPEDCSSYTMDNFSGW